MVRMVAAEFLYLSTHGKVPSSSVGLGQGLVPGDVEAVNPAIVHVPVLEPVHVLNL